MNTPNWFPEHPPLYDISKSYHDNAEFGPFFTGEIPERVWPPETEWYDFLGFRVASRIGVPAGPLLNSKWTTLAAKLGYDIVTYKTIRSREEAGHPLPNMLYVDIPGDSDIRTLSTPLQTRATLPKDMNDLAVTNSFGMPSYGPKFLREDIDRARRQLHTGQVLIVSVVGTPRDGEDFMLDFVQTALLAKEAGAPIIEANFSCPNVCSGEGSIFTNPETVGVLSTKLVKALGDTPLIIKVGVYPDENMMKKVFLAAAQAGVRAIEGINTVGRAVVTPEGHPALGASRLTSGICGGPIRGAGLDFVRSARTIITEEKLDLTLLGVGGITEAKHFDEFLTEGADFALSATGMLWDPYLATTYHSLTNL
jgi:dihydroorotate dehydrogenase